MLEYIVIVKGNGRRIFLGVFLLLFANASYSWAADEAKRLLSLVDYIGGDYRNAVTSGKVINADEYQEMTEFSTRALELFNQLKTDEGGDKAGIEKELGALAAHIQSKSGDEIVPQLAQDIKTRLIKTYNIITYPKAIPDYQSAGAIYTQNCAQCHGESGRGDGPGRESMNPKTPPPANFADADFMGGLSPFKVYNTTTFGIDKTAMASFAALPDEQRWQVSFYVLALRFSAEAAAAGEKWLKGKSLPNDLLSVATLATSSDDELSEKIGKSFPGAPSEEILAYLRRGLLEKKANDPMLVARNLIGEAAEIYSQGDKERAYQKAIEAYLDGFEMAEPALFAKDASFGRSLEAQFTQFRNSIRKGVSTEEIQKQRQDIQARLDQAAGILSESDDFAGYYAFLNSALIILREGLEAALILAAIVATMRVMGAPTPIRYIHLGWMLALARRRADLARCSNGADFQRSASRKHGRIHLDLRRRCAFLRRLLAAHAERGEALAGVHPGQSPERTFQEEYLRPRRHFVFRSVSGSLRGGAFLSGALAAERKQPHRNSRWYSPPAWSFWSQPP